MIMSTATVSTLTHGAVITIFPMTMMVLFAVSGVCASNADSAYSATASHKLLDKMTLDESKSFVQNRIGSWNGKKHTIHDFVTQSVHVGTSLDEETLPPIACFVCNADLCVDAVRDKCIECCLNGDKPLCFDCEAHS